MSVKLIKVAVFLGLSQMMFSCVQTEDFYEKEKAELEETLNKQCSLQFHSPFLHIG